MNKKKFLTSFFILFIFYLFFTDKSYRTNEFDGIIKNYDILINSSIKSYKDSKNFKVDVIENELNSVNLEHNSQFEKNFLEFKEEFVELNKNEFIVLDDEVSIEDDLIFNEPINDSINEPLNEIIDKEILNVYKTDSKDNLFIDDSKGFYNYCPTIIKQDKNFVSFYCANKNAYEIEDYIYYRKSTEVDDKFIYEDKIEVLAPSSKGWDSVHVCDPSVIKGNFIYNNQNYQYLMAYLGCDTYDNQKNKIGFAVSNFLDKGWVKTESINPLISIPYDKNHKDSFQWGVGQASLISLENGLVLIFYTQGTYKLTSEIVELWDLYNLNEPIQIWKTTLSNLGTNDFISNADFVYENNTLYMICDVHPFTGNVLSNIPDKTNIYKTYIEDFSSKDEFKNCKWEYVYSLNKNTTSYNKNHNTCFVRDEFGKFIGNYVAYSYAVEKNNFLNSLWTYRFKLKKF